MMPQPYVSNMQQCAKLVSNCLVPLKKVPTKSSSNTFGLLHGRLRPNQAMSFLQNSDRDPADGLCLPG